MSRWTGESWCPQILKRLGIKTFMSHFQSFVQILKMLAEICVLFEDQFKRGKFINLGLKV